MGKNILVVDDDPHIREVVRFALEQAGHQVREASNGQDALKDIGISPTDLMILDIVMPEMDGFETCKTLRQTSQIPILFLSSRSDEIDRIIGLEIGGDDYVTKPFSPRELVARVNVILKRLLPVTAKTEVDTPALDILEKGNIQLHPLNYSVFWNLQPVILTATEFRLLQIFLKSPNRVYTREDLIALDIFPEVIQDRTIDSHIRRLRKKFTDLGCQSVVETVHGFGYKLGDCS
ncbi:MAG: response regulator transcription factor [Cyanobacteria bacterium]|nr:response regulator transcription factor [Cyanobacteriota bacterium]